MCGINGLIDPQNRGKPAVLEDLARRMADTLRHRGPDDAGVWSEPDVGLALGHRRLAIVDLSEEGHQPMASPDGRWMVAYNGEIYNFPDLRAELAERGHVFTGSSDTTVLLAAVAEWGLEAALKRFVGMFAFALWDREKRVLHLARDRFGKKPLYYGWLGDRFLFASELKAIVPAAPGRLMVDRAALALYMRHNYVPHPRSIFHGISKLPPGTFVSLRAEPATVAGPRPYWSARAAMESAASRRFQGSVREAADRLDALLRLSVRQRMVADVPVGAFLSGGVDSTVVASLMQAESDTPVRTFTIGFHEDEYDEADQARRVAEHLNTEHTELYLTPEEALAVIPRLPQLYDEPFADASQIPTFLVSRMARAHVTVALSGDGGDELFSGYERYALAAGTWRRLAAVPSPLRRLAGQGMTRVDTATWDRLLATIRPVLPKTTRRALTGDRAHKFAPMLAAKGPVAFYQQLVSHWKDPQRLVPGSAEPLTAFTDPEQQADLPTFEDQMMFLDTVGYLPDDILVKVDRASMGVSLETRAPLLDHRVAEFAWSLPLSMKLRDGERKWILRQVLDRYVPREIMAAPKKGFSVPVARWLRGPLREWAETLLSESRLREEAYLDAQAVRKKWEEHLSGKRNWHYMLWDVLMFQEWLERNRDHLEGDRPFPVIA